MVGISLKTSKNLTSIEYFPFSIITLEFQETLESSSDEKEDLRLDKLLESATKANIGTEELLLQLTSDEIEQFEKLISTSEGRCRLHENEAASVWWDNGTRNELNDDIRFKVDSELENMMNDLNTDEFEKPVVLDPIAHPSSLSPGKIHPTFIIVSLDFLYTYSLICRTFDFDFSDSLAVFDVVCTISAVASTHLRNEQWIGYRDIVECLENCRQGTLQLNNIEGHADDDNTLVFLMADVSMLIQLENIEHALSHLHSIFISIKQSVDFCGKGGQERHKRRVCIQMEKKCLLLLSLIHYRKKLEDPVGDGIAEFFVVAKDVITKIGQIWTAEQDQISKPISLIQEMI